MMKMTTTLIASVLVLISTVPATAQQQRSNTSPLRVPTMVVLVDSIQQPDAPYVIVRRPGRAPADLILLRSGAGPNEFSDAVRGLLTARFADGDIARTAATFRVRPNRPNATPRAAFPWAPRVVNDLRRAQLREMHGLGRVRAVQIWLPAQGAGEG